MSPTGQQQTRAVQHWLRCTSLPQSHNAAPAQGLIDDASSAADRVRKRMGRVKPFLDYSGVLPGRVSALIATADDYAYHGGRLRHSSSTPSTAFSAS